MIDVSVAPPAIPIPFHRFVRSPISPSSARPAGRAPQAFELFFACSD